MRALFVIPFLAVLFLPTAASAEVQTFTAAHTYILGDHDSKDDARQRCLLEAKRKVLEQAGVYIESASEVKDFQLAKDKITSFAAAVMQVKETKETAGFESGHMTMTLTIKADVDLVEVRKQLAARQVDKGVRDEVAQQKERLKRLEARFEAMQQQRQDGQIPGQTPTPSAIDISSVELQEVKARAANGDSAAQAELGLRYALGSGVPQDYIKARQWWEQAAAQGNASAHFNLGMLYDKGDGVPQDYVKARQWYEAAAAQEHARAKFLIGRLYELGRGVPQDNAQARQWFEQAAAQGDAMAQTNLGWLYYNGQGVSQDYARARQWFEQAAAQGDAKAQANLGLMYYNGQGVSQDYARARQWFKQAASQGVAEAQYNLATLYEYDQGVLDYMRAYMWFNLAAAQLTGDLQKTAADARDSVASRLTPAQLAEAQRLVQQCQLQHFKNC